MTRKRFIKLCMSCGYQRNEAQAIATKAVLPYQQEYERIVFIWRLRVVRNKFERFGKQIVKAFTPIFANFCNAARDMAHFINRD